MRRELTASERAWLAAYRAGARDVAELRERGWAAGKGLVKQYVRVWARPFAWPPAYTSYVDAYLDSVGC
jgi:hypothetical protein